MRYILFLTIALASCGYAQPIKQPSAELLNFKIDNEEDYDVASVISKEKLVAEITEVSIKNPIIYPYNTNSSALILTDIIGVGNLYKIAQYVKISAGNGRLYSIYNCRAELTSVVKVDPNLDESGDYFRNIIWNEKVRNLKVRNEVCEVAQPIRLWGNTF